MTSDWPLQGYPVYCPLRAPMTRASDVLSERLRQLVAA